MENDFGDFGDFGTNDKMAVLKGKQKSMQTTLEIYAKDSQFLVQDAKFDVEKIAKLDGNGNITVNYIKKKKIHCFIHRK